MKPPLSKEELKAMDQEELLAYITSGGNMAVLLEDAVPGPDLGPAPNWRDMELKLTSVRLPLGMVERMDKFAGNDKDGRSGIIREAVARYLAELDAQQQKADAA